LKESLLITDSALLERDINILMGRGNSILQLSGTQAGILRIGNKKDETTSCS
jgi:hypothetical protein